MFVANSPIVWVGPVPKHCQLCSAELYEAFIDGKIGKGPWGVMCIRCHDVHGNGLGLGKGQLYNYDHVEKCFKSVVIG